MGGPHLGSMTSLWRLYFFATPFSEDGVSQWGCLEETVSLNGGVCTPPLSDRILNAWAGSGPDLGQAFFLLFFSPSSPQCRMGLVNPEAEGRQ